MLCFVFIFLILFFVEALQILTEELFWRDLKAKKDSINALIHLFPVRSEDYDYEWLLEHNDVTNSESRILLAMLTIPQVKPPATELIQELVDWSQNLDADQFGVFKNKDFTDIQEIGNWVRISSEAIFNPTKNPLFLECPDDPTRFHMNNELKPKPFHYECAKFAGNLIALDLIYGVRTGVALDHGFLSQLSEEWDDSSSESRCENKVLVSFFAKGFAKVFGVPIKELLCFRGLEVEDINKALHRLCRCSCHNCVSDDKGMKEADVDPLLLQYQRVRKEGRRIKNWRRGPKLGSGCYGEVYLGLADGGFFFAAKRVPLTDAQKVSSIEKEIDLLCQFNHENIVEYFGTKKEETDLYIFLEFVSGSSLDKVYREYILDEFQVSCYTKQILEGLKYLHERNIKHGDIKCANVLLNEDGNVKIADFGLATTTWLSSLRKSSGVWSAPEAINTETQEGYGFEADIWSVGYTVLEMLIREYPNSFPPTIPDTLPTDSRDFITRCLQVKPEERPTVAQLLEHPFVKKVIKSNNNL